MYGIARRRKRIRRIRQLGANSFGSELRGTADGEFGALMLASGRLDTAGFFLESGLQINRELLRKLDAAYILGDRAEIDLAANESGLC